MTERDYFTVLRSLLRHDLWLSEPFTRGQAWVDLIGLARWKDGFVRVRGQQIQVKRGEVAWSIKGLADRWQWSRGKVRRFMDELKTDTRTDTRESNGTPLLVIVNYDCYQPDGHQDGHLADTQRTPRGHPTDTKEEGKESKEGKEGKESKKRTCKFVPPTVEEVEAYAKEKGYKIDAEHFHAHHETRGWMLRTGSMKSWKSAVVTWMKNTPFFSPPANGDGETDWDAFDKLVAKDKSKKG